MLKKQHISVTPEGPRLSRRERQIVEILYRRGESAVSQVLAEMEDPPSYSAVRALLNVLVRKGHVLHRREGLRYVYRPRHPRGKAARSALLRTVRTFFEGSPEKAVAALLDLDAVEMSPRELARIERMIREAREKRKE